MRIKILSINILFLLITIIFTVGFMSWRISVKGKNDIKEYTQEETTQISDSLKNYVNLAYETIESSYNQTKDKKVLEERYGHRLKSIIDIAESLINDKLAQVNSREISMAEAKRQIKREIKLLRYDNGIGYVWINNTDQPYPRMVMHPISPSLDGQIMDDKKYNCAMGKNQNLFQAFLEVSFRDGGGFVDYLWPKPNQRGVEVDVPKLSYVRLIKSLGWIIGTGIYVDDAMEDAKQQTLMNVRNMIYDNGDGYFWINDQGQPYPKMIMHPISPVLEGNILDDAKYNIAFGTDQNIFRAFVEVAEKNKTSGGFVDYEWHHPKKPDGQSYPKKSYVRLFEPWGWVIGTGTYTDTITEKIVEKNKRNNSQIRLNIFIIIIITLIILGVSIVAIIFLISNILAPLGSMKEIVGAVSQGNLTTTVDVYSNDEIGDMSEQFNMLINNFKVHLKKIKEVANVMNKSISDLSVTSKEIATTSNQQSVAVKEIVTTMEDNNELSKGVQNKIREVAKISNKTKEDVKQGFSFIKTNIDKVGEIKVTNVNTINGIRSLGEQIDSIWDIVNIINTIADQTKIIAFNAELEASSAGEAGKNFEIVASEIRRLADNTVSSTKEIRLKIDEIQKASDSLILTSEQGTRKIEEGWSLSRKLEKVFKTIYYSSQVSADSSSKITSLINQQVVSFEQIFITLKQISEGIENFVISTRNTTETSDTLKDMAGDLNGIIDTYKVD